MLSHDFGQGTMIKSFPPVAIEDQLHWPEAMAVKAFGEFAGGIRTPRCRYMSVWRDPEAYLARGADRPPAKIIMAASFAQAAVESPADLNRLGELSPYMTTGLLRLDLVAEGDGDFRVEAIEFEITDPTVQRNGSFRSCWKGEELKGLDLMVQIDAPRLQDAPLRFHVAGRLPRRFNHGAKVEQQIVAFTVSGGALPMPSWVNY